MAKTRLTKAIREEIFFGMMNAMKFAERKKELRRQADRELRGLLVMAEPKEFQEAMQKVPNKYLRRTHRIHINTNKSEIKITPFENAGYYYVLDDPVPSAELGDGDRVVDVMQIPGLFDMLKRYEGPLLQLMEEEKNFSEQLRSVLNAAYTVEALIDRFPEAAPFVPKSESIANIVNPQLTANLVSMMTRAGLIK